MAKVKVLALSGGGYRGLYTVGILKRIEEATGKRISEHFDLITGTSIGGIIALAIAKGIPMDRVEEVFLTRGRSIFPKPVEVKSCSLPQLPPFDNQNLFLKLLLYLIAPLYWLASALFSFIATRLAKLFSFFRKCRALFRPIHKQAGLKAILEELFADTRMKDLNKAFVCITAANVGNGEPKMFKTPHAHDLGNDAENLVVDVALATSAAPAYFPLHKIPIEHRNSGVYADGALLGNAPGIFGWIESITRLTGDDVDVFKDVQVLSIGTLGGHPSISNKASMNQGVLFWMAPPRMRLLTFLMGQQELLTHYILRLVLGDNYYLIDGQANDEAATDIALDDASEGASNALLTHADRHFAEFQSKPLYKSLFS